MKLICSNVVNHKIFSPGFIQSIPDFDVPFPVKGTGMTNSNPIFGNGNGNENSIKFHSLFREREWEWKIPFPTFGTGIGGRYSEMYLCVWVALPVKHVLLWIVTGGHRPCWLWPDKIMTHQLLPHTPLPTPSIQSPNPVIPLAFELNPHSYLVPNV